MKTNLITLAALAGLMVLLLLHLHEVRWTATAACGTAIAAISFVLLVVARLQLGASFSVQAKAHHLVTTGLYARVRNPIYLFGGLMLVGLAMMWNNWALLVIALILIPVQRVRARREEAVLEEAFGEEYLRYKARTWF